MELELEGGWYRCVVVRQQLSPLLGISRPEWCPELDYHSLINCQDNSMECSHGSWLVQVERGRVFCQGRHLDQGWSVWNKVAHINLRRQHHQGCYLNTAGVPLPKPLISNIIMCLRNSPTLKMSVVDCQSSPCPPTWSKKHRKVHRYFYPLDNKLDILRNKVPFHQPGWLIGRLLSGGKLQSIHNKIYTALYPGAGGCHGQSVSHHFF